MRKRDDDSDLRCRCSCRERAAPGQGIVLRTEGGANPRAVGSLLDGGEERDEAWPED